MGHPIQSLDGGGYVVNFDELFVIVGGVTAIVWVNWYFRVLGRRGDPPRIGRDGSVEIRENEP